MSNASLIKVDKAKGEGKGRKGGENMEVKRSKGDETQERGQFFVSFLPRSDHVFTLLSVYLVASYNIKRFVF